MKIDSTSQLQWSKTYGDKGTDTPCGLVQLSDGGFAMAGTWTTINKTATVSTMGLLRLDSSGQTSWIKTYNAKQNATTISYDLANAMVRTSDGSYVIEGSTLFGGEYHQDVFFVKTETFEQPLQPTATPTISSSIDPTTKPTVAPMDSPAVSQTTSSTQTPTSSGSSSAPSPSIPEIPQWLTISVIFATTTLLFSFRRKKSRMGGIRIKSD
jgi:hypothetical protein